MSWRRRRNRKKNQLKFTVDYKTPLPGQQAESLPLRIHSKLSGQGLAASHSSSWVLAFCGRGSPIKHRTVEKIKDNWDSSLGKENFLLFVLCYFTFVRTKLHTFPFWGKIVEIPGTAQIGEFTTELGQGVEEIFGCKADAQTSGPSINAESTDQFWKWTNGSR